jgi:hypothetical protein
MIHLSLRSIMKRPRSTVNRAAFALFAVAALAVLLPGAAIARWSAPATLTAPGNGAFLPTVASNGNGRVVSAWYRMAGGANQVLARISFDGGLSWGQRQVLGAAALSQGGNAPALIRAAVGAGGGTAVVWQQNRGGRLQIVAALAGAGGRFSSPRAVSAAGVGSSYPDVAVDATGRAAVVWVTLTAVQQALISPGRQVSGPRTVANAPLPAEPTIAANSAGQLLIAWVETTPATATMASRTPVVAARESSSGALTAPQPLSPDGADQPQVALSKTGQATVAWEQTYGLVEPLLAASSAPWGRRFGALQKLSPSGPEAILGGAGAGSRGLGVDAAGRVSAIWAEDLPLGVTAGTARVVSAASNPAGRFGPGQTLQVVGGGQSFERAAIGVAPLGARIASWTVLSGAGASYVRGSVANSPSGRFGAPSTLSAPRGDASAVAATSPSGAGIAVWSLGAAEGSGAGAIQASIWSP